MTPKAKSCEENGQRTCRTGHHTEGDNLNKKLRNFQVDNSQQRNLQHTLRMRNFQAKRSIPSKSGGKMVCVRAFPGLTLIIQLFLQ